MMNHRQIGRLLAVCAAGWAGLARAEGPIEVPLAYQAVGENSREFYPRGMISPELAAAAPEGEWKLPEWTSKHPVFTRIKLGDREHLLVLDVSSPRSKMFDRLYFDANANRDLTDDPVISGKVEAGYGNQDVEFPPMAVTVETGGRSLPYRMRPSIYAYKRGSGETSKAFPRMTIRFMLQTLCYYRGEFEAGGARYRLHLADVNANGVFGEAATEPDSGGGRIFMAGDAFYLSTNKPGYYEAMTCGTHWHLGGQLFAVSLAPGLEKLTLTPAEGPLFPLSFSTEPDRIMLFNAGAKQSVACFRPGREIRLPAGSYRFADYRLLRKETNGALWQLLASATTGAPPVEVGADRQAELVLGEPFRPVVEIPEWSRAVKSGNQPVRMSFAIRGAANEIVNDVSLLSGQSALTMGKRGARPKEPAYTIATPEGELVQRGSFEYG
ncbi:MAG TPA: hypothetical protein P5567_07055 [Kiritimatiellia bacterium]|nr:hypothetical protein [Kiritimatiellia bacterium]HRZ12197.1 hypothetical protein [Kiritimatiellia bacterium]HSA18045.1 hypothetical protein [Kiritimatiellia bacterium]